MHQIAAENMPVQGKSNAARYVEGESSDEDEDEDDVPVEVGDEGEVEDVDMRGFGSDG